MVPVPADGQDALMDAALFRRPPDRFVDVGEGAVAVRTVGSGPDVVLVHGWPVSGATWRRLLPHLTPHVTCHVLDLVGAGDSRFDRSSRLDLDLHVRSVRALFRAFVATGRLPGFAAVFGRLVVARRLRRSPLVLGGAFHDKALLDGEFDELLLRPLHDDADKRWAAGQLVRSFDMALVRDLPQVHAAIPAPVQLVWGDGDPFFPVDRAREMVPSFPDAQLTVVPQARLFVHEERPEQVAAALLPVLLGTRRAAA
jgi:haloalkane dehalogenase